MQNRLVDKYGRELSYLRLSVTDRCNLRCYYCMPEHGMQFAQRKDLLTWDEMYFLTSLFTGLGVSKIRITGGEPFVREGLLSFFENIKFLPHLEDISITTNATLLDQHIDRLKALNITHLNISLDSLDAKRFYSITRRDSFYKVYSTILSLIENGFTVKLNCVVSSNKNVEDIIPFIELTKTNNLSVRFLEEMPFNGSRFFDDTNWTHKNIEAHIHQHYNDMIEVLPNPPHSTSVNYKVKGYTGSFGIIPSYSRTFCGTCNRLRLSATGELRTCLYAAPALNLRDAIRSGAGEEEMISLITNAVAGRWKDGFEAEAQNHSVVHDSMSVLGG